MQYGSLIGLMSIGLLSYLLFFIIKKNEGIRLIIYFIASCAIIPIYQKDTPTGEFVLWFPMGFIIVLIYLFYSPRKNRARMIAVGLGFTVAICRLLLQYNVI